MRIIGGKYKGTILQVPSKLTLRPTTDLSKEAIFNILTNTIDYENMTVLDLFSGTGSIAMEFTSRGAKVAAIELNRAHASFIIKTAEKLKADNLRVYIADALKYIQKSTDSYDLIFADPPYDLPQVQEIPSRIFASKLLKPGGLFILEHSKRIRFTSEPTFEQVRNYGAVHFSFFRSSSCL